KKARKFTRRHDLLGQTAANVTSTSPWFIANFQRFRELSEGQRRQGELLHTAADWLYSFDVEAAGRRAAARNGGCSGRVARDRTAIRGGVAGIGSRSRADRHHVVARSEARCAEEPSAQRSKPSAHRRVLYALTCATQPARAASGHRA